MLGATFITALFAAGALAKPHGVKRSGGDTTCLSLDDATFVADTWANLIANYTKDQADAALVEDFVDYSESVNSLINNCPQGAAAISLPLLNPTFTNRTQFEIGQSQQPPLTFDVLEVFPGCGSVAFRWMTNDTAPIPNPRPVVGNIIIKTVKNPTAGTTYKYLIDTVYSEFDSGDWIRNLQDAGICPTSSCSASSSTPAATTTVASTVTVTPMPTITQAPETTSTSTDADGNVWIIVTEIDDVYVTATDVVTVTLS